MNNTADYMRNTFLVICFLFSTLTIKGQTQDSIRTVILHEVSVKANKKLYKTKPDAIIYDVSSDSTLVGKNSFEALRNAPLLNVARNGSVHSVGNWPIEYLVNGGHDSFMSGNLQDALETLDSKYLKSIESRIVRGVDGEEKLQVNIVTKGRILGYRGLFNTGIYDDKWRNGAFVFSKKNRWGISASYYNTWLWGHESTSESEEWKYGSTDCYRTYRKSTDSGYKVDLNNFEVNLSYDVTPLKKFSVFARALLKANPGSKSTVQSTVENNGGGQTYSYNYKQKYRVGYDAEYMASVDYEQLFGENAERGKFYVGYELYSRPMRSHTIGDYTQLDYRNQGDVQDFYDMNENLSKYVYYHTLTLLYRREMGHHKIFAEDFVRYRDEHSNLTQVQGYKYRVNPSESRREEIYKYKQMANGLKVGYGYGSSKWDVQMGLNHLLLHDSSDEPLRDNAYSATNHYFLPYTDVSYAFCNWARMQLSYAMGKQSADIWALNPYVETDIPGQLTYGNPKLHPQTTQVLSLAMNMTVGKFNMYVSSRHSWSKDIILRHSFVQGEMLHVTMDNIGKRYENSSRFSVSSKVTRSTWVQGDVNVTYTDYARNAVYSRNHGCTFSANAYVEQELPQAFDVSVGGGFNTPYIFMQGKGGRNFYYNLRIDRTFVKSRIVLSAEASSFIPLRYENTHTQSSPDYYKLERNRGFHASFALSLSWKFGRLRAEEHRTDERYDNQDIKRNYDE